MTRIAIADDHTLFRKSLSLLVNSFENMEVVTEAANGQELLEQLKTTEVDILLLDLQMPEMDGFEAGRIVNARHPHVKILVLTLLDDIDTIREVLKMDVQGYFTKNTDPSELRNALSKLKDDGFYFEKSLNDIIRYVMDEPGQAVEIFESFTEREREIVLLTLKERSGIEIGEMLNISHRTVEKHKKNLMEKTGAKNFIGVITYAFLHGILSQEVLKE